MGFKEKLLDYCENKLKVDCSRCSFKTTCDKVDEDALPSQWNDKKFERLKESLANYYTELSGMMSEIEEILED